MTTQGVVEEAPVSFRELKMNEIREVIRQWQAGTTLRGIARAVGLDRKTVRRYVDALQQVGVTADSVPDDAVVHLVASRVQTRAVAEPSAEREELMLHRERIAAWLTQSKPLRLSKIHTLLVRDHQVAVSYATLRRFAIDEFRWGLRKPTVRVVDAPPAEEAQVDFGLMMTLPDPVTRKPRKLYALVVTLCFSRYQFVWPTFGQTTVAICEGLDEAWRFFGGIVQRIIPDNASSMVKRADALGPTLTEAFVDYTQARGLYVDAARVRCPRDKGRVENQIAFVRESCFAGETIETLDEMRTHARRWCDISGERIHGTTRRQPREHFVLEERPLLASAPDDTFDVPHWSDAKVHPDHCVQVLKALYSVPTRYIGKRVRVRADRRTVRIYLGTELIKTHIRIGEGKRQVDPKDYPDGIAEYAMRSVDGLMQRAHKRGEHIGVFAERLLGGPLPWTKMRQGYELLRLCERHGDERVEALCQAALEFDAIDVVKIGRMLKHAIQSEQQAPETSKLLLLNAPRFARAADGFATRKDGAR